MSDEQARMQILELIESGKVTTSEGLRLLAALQNNSGPALLNQSGFEERVEEHAVFAEPDTEEPEAAAQEAPPAEPEILETRREFTAPPNMRRWRRWWMLPFWFGVATTVLGGLFMYLALSARGISIWLVLASLPFIAGLVFTVLAWQARNARWLHLRIDNIQGSGPKHLAFSFPLPLRTAAWVLRTFGHKVPHVEGVSFDEILKAVDKGASPDNPLYIQVNDEEDGERVEIYIG
jgi:hypothetical protein